jgi:hypothetical protein
MIGKIFSHCEIIGKIGEGRMGTVVTCHPHRLLHFG